MKGRKPRAVDIEEDEDKIESEYKGRKIVCTCDEDPDWCEKHNAW